jgi:lipoprotein-anchoring transpeptidase ErfK/SrfK
MAWWDGRDTYNAYFIPMSTWYRNILDDLARTYPDRVRDPVLIVRVGEQRLYLFERGLPMQHYPVSTSRFGVGNQDGSLRTPLGVHQVRRRIGDQVPPGTIFRGRRNTGEVARILNGPGGRSLEDNITSRILWLDGLEEGVNRGDGIDSFQRFIYIHGTDEEGRIGQPASDGCVRMTNTDVIELFDRVPQGTLVVIVE